MFTSNSSLVVTIPRPIFAEIQGLLGPPQQLSDVLCLQGLSDAAGSEVRISFTPHLMPMSRGMQSTIYVKLAGGNSADDLRSHLQVTLTHGGKQNPFASAARLAVAQRGHLIRHS